MTPNPQAQIVQYIEQNRNTYTRAAITQQLITAGYNPADVEAAWGVVETGGDAARIAGGTAPDSLAAMPPGTTPGGPFAPPPRQRVVSSPAFWLTMVGFILASYILPAVTFYLGTLSNNSDVISTVSTLSGLLFFAIAIAGLVGGVILLGRNRPVGMGLLMGLLIGDVVLPFVAVIIVFGICVVLLAGLSRGTP